MKKNKTADLVEKIITGIKIICVIVLFMLVAVLAIQRFSNNDVAIVQGGKGIIGYIDKSDLKTDCNIDKYKIVFPSMCGAAEIDSNGNGYPFKLNEIKSSSILIFAIAIFINSSSVFPILFMKTLDFDMPSVISPYCEPI